jgi:hypothetical protein
VPEEVFVVSIHWHFRQPVKIGRNFVICHRMSLSICIGASLRSAGLYLSLLNRLRP